MSKKDIAAINPLSPAQQGMLYECIRAPESGIHIEQSIYTLSGKIDVAAFERAWQWGVDRHAILRTGFVWKEQVEPLQVTVRHVRMGIDYHDWRGVASTEQKERLESYIRDDRVRGFALAQAPLMRLALFHLDEQHYRFVWTSHHILMDGWSHQTLLNEVITCYAALLKNQVFTRKPAPAYGDYIAWLKKQNVSEAEDFWRTTLRGFNKPTPLGIEQVGIPPDEPIQRLEPVQIQLSATQTANLHSVIRSHHVTLNTVLQGVWAILLSRYSHSEDIVFGVTVSGRPAELAGVEAMVGLCINTLPLRVHVPAQASFWPWLSDLQRQNVEMHRYEYCSAGQIHRWSDMPGMSLLYESLLVVENYPASTVPSAVFDMDLTVDNVLLVGAQTKYAFTLLVMTGDILVVRCTYDARLLSHASVRTIMDHVQRLLAYIAADPQAQLATLADMIPADQIPVVHRAPRSVQEKPVSDGQAPRNPMEELVAAVWCDVLVQYPKSGSWKKALPANQPPLSSIPGSPKRFPDSALGLNQVDINSNFFLLGGHSLVVTQMTSRLRAVLGVEIPLRIVFESPTVAGLALRIEEALRKREGMEVPPLVAGERPDAIPLSFAQQRLWFLAQMEAANTTYLVSNAYRMLGMLDTRALERSLNEVVRRHESLRTTFMAGKMEQPVQVIHPAHPFVWPIIDLQGLAEEQRAQEAQLLARQEARLPSDLVRGPLMRFYLLRLAKQEHVVVLTLHHIITDRWSNEILIHELVTLYRTHSQGQVSTLPPLPFQYADYALWQRQWLQGEVLQQQIAYWKKQLWRAQPLELPVDATRSEATQSNHGALCSYTFSEKLWRDLVSLSQQEGVTLFMLLLAIFQVLLYRLSGQTDIVVGTDIANRTHVETEGLIGFFVNLLALRTDLQGAPTFQKVVQQVRAMVLGAYTHQELPFEMVVENVQVERKEHMNPLVQVLFVMQNTPRIADAIPGITVEYIQEKHTAARFDLAWFMSEGEQNLKATIVYRTALFKEQTIATLLHRFEVMAESIVAGPGNSIDELEIRTAEEKAAQASHEKKLHSAGSRNWRNGQRNAVDVSALTRESIEQGKSS